MRLKNNFSIIFAIFISLFIFCVCSFQNVYAAAGNTTITKIYNSKTGIVIKWSSSRKYDGYMIYRSVDDSKYAKIDSTKSKKYTDTDIGTGEVYRYKIRPYNLKNGKKVYFDKSKGSDACLALPYSVSGATVVSYSDHNLISWNKNSFASGYYIYRSKDNIHWELLSSMNNSSGFYEDYTIEKGLKYSYKIVVYEIVDGEIYESLPVMALEVTQVKGIDVSYHNGKINWKKVKKSGITFAIIRLGYGTRKGGIVDSKLDYNYKQARKYGIKVGFYLYSYADNTKEAKNEAKFTAKLLEKYTKFDYPIVFDFENPYRNKKKYKKSNTKIISTYCNYLEKKGYDTCVYSYLDFLKKSVDYKKVSKYGIWLARWTGNPKKFNNGGIPNVQLWQYSDNGRINGIQGAVDMNVQVMLK